MESSNCGGCGGGCSSTSSAVAIDSFPGGQSAPTPPVSGKIPRVFHDPRRAGGKKNRWYIKKWRVGVLIGINLMFVMHWTLAKLHLVKEGHSDPNDIYLFLKTGQIKIVAVIFGVWLLTVPILGRAGCGWICHMGAWQEFFAWGMNKIGLYNHKAVHSRYLKWVLGSMYPVLFLGAVFVSWQHHGIMYQGIHYDPTKDLEPVWVFDGIMTAFFILPLLTLPVMLLGTRAICRYTCPFNLYFRVLEKISWRKIVKTDHCLMDPGPSGEKSKSNCNLCSKNCTMGIDVVGQIQAHGYVKDVECIKCMTCVQVCPTHTLSYLPVTLSQRRELQAAATPPSVPLYEREFMSKGTEAYLFVILGLVFIASGFDYTHFMLHAPWTIGVGLLLLVSLRKLKAVVVRRASVA